MRLIPVIDLKDGVVVHARQGNRAQYHPLHSPLSASCDIYAVIAAFLRVYDFDTFYLADLNAITQQGNNALLIAQVLARFPERNFWVDCGYQRYKLQPANYFPVLGSECYNDNNADELADFQRRFILSLDYAASGQALGAQRFFSEVALWSENIIIMTLNRVGSQQGADVEKLSAFCRDYPQHNFIAAGGVRNFADCLALKQIGVQQVLLASALHSLAITRTDIEKL